MGRYAYEIIGGILIFASSYVSEPMPRRRRIALWIVFGAMAIGYSSLGIYVDTITERDQRLKDADNEQVLRALKSQIQTLVRAEPMDTSNIRQDLLILEAELQHTITGKPYQRPPVPMI